MVEGGVIVAAAAGGWMRRCILIGAVRQSDVWADALQATASISGVELVLLSSRPDGPVHGDEHRIFLSSDLRYFAETVDAECVAVLDGVDHVSGIAQVADEPARIHLIEVSRYAVEAMCWKDTVKVVTSAAADAVRCGDLLELFGLPIRPPVLHPVGDDPADLRAVKALAYLNQAEAFWGPRQFIYDREPAELSEEEAVFEMTGPPRPLLRGPYLWAPVGRWKIKAAFSMDSDGARHRVQFRWGPPLKPTIFEVDIDRSGLYEVELEADWPEIDGMELTIALLYGSIAGQFVFRGATVTGAAD